MAQALEVIDAALATAGKPCELGNDPSKHLERFEDWYGHTSLLADSIGVKNDGQKLKLILLWGGRQFRKYAKEAGIVMEGEEQDNLNEAIAKIKAHCGKHVNLSMAVFTHVKGLSQLRNMPETLRSYQYNVSLTPNRMTKTELRKMHSYSEHPMTSCVKKHWPKIGVGNKC